MPSVTFGQRGTKFRNRPTTVDGIRFASMREANRYVELMLLARVGDITDLECQPRYRLEVRGKLIATYVADFRYRRAGDLVVEDVKSQPTRTPVYRLKAKLLEALHGIRIVEIE